MGTNNKNSPSNDRTVINVSPNNKKTSNGRPTPSKSINIKTPNKNHSPNNLGQTNNKRISGSCSPPNFSFFAASKCFESPSPQSLPKPPTSWFFDEASKSNNKRNNQRTAKSQRVRKSLNLSAVESSPSTCAQEFAKQQNSSFTSISNEQYTQQLKFLLNVNA